MNRADTMDERRNGATVDSSFSPGRPGTPYAFRVASVAAFGGFLFGYDLHIITAAQLFWRPYFGLSDQAYGFAMSVAILGCIAGPLLGSWACDKVGRRNTLALAGVLFGASAIGTAVALDVVTFDIFRFVGGVAVGLASIASPMYIAEISPPHLRGRLGLMYQMAIVIGSTSSALVGWLLSTGGHWRWMFASELAPIAGFLLLVRMVPRSPRWLAENGRGEEAEGILTRINGPKTARREMEGIRADLEQENGTFAELFRPGVKMALACAVLLAFFNNLTGWSGIAYYLPDIFQRGGYADPSLAIRNMLILNVFNMFFTLVCIGCVDRLGRRPLWMYTSLAMIFALGLAATTFHMGWTGPVVILVIVATTIPHHLGLGPLPWLMMSELFPTRLRAKGVAISTTVVWIGGFSAAFLFPVLAGWSERAVGSIAGIFAVFAVVCVFSWIFGVRLLPETKGRSLEEIAASWRTRA